MSRHTCLLASLLGILLLSTHLSAQVVTDREGRVGIGTLEPDKNASLTLDSRLGGLLLPRMTEQQRDRLVNPPTGLLIFNTTKGTLDYNFGTALSPKWTEVVTTETVREEIAATAWLLEGNEGTDPGVNFLGTTDNRAFEIHVAESVFSDDTTSGSGRVVRYEPRSESPNIIAGYHGNSVAEQVQGAVIAGGGRASAGSLVLANRIDGSYGFVGGGWNNHVRTQGGVIVGGSSNTVDSGGIVVGGFSGNALGRGSFIGGANSSTVYGSYSTLIGGFRAYPKTSNAYLASE